MWIQRNITPILRRAVEQFPVVVLTGARQSGKTSLVRHLFPEARYVTFDVPAAAELARLDFDTFLQRYPTPVIIDEVQYAPEVLRFIKIHVDQRRAPGQFILTGSQDFSMMEGVSESLAGRAAVLSLPSVTLDEASVDVMPEVIDRFCWRGSYPELVARPELDRELWLGSYLATYLERDVRNIVQIGNLRDFDRFLRSAALRAGQLLSFSELARDVGIAPNTARAWVSILESSRQIFLLEPYHSHGGKRLVKSPKLYFTDTGMLLYLLGFARWDDVTRHALWGAVWENLVISEIRKHYLNAGHRPPLWFWRTQQQDEVDLIIETGPKRFRAVECKTAAQIDAKALKGFTALEKDFGPQALERAAVVCRTAQAYPLNEGGRFSAVPLGGNDGVLDWLG